MSLADVIDSLSSDEDIVVTRRATGAFDDDTGKWVPGPATTFTLSSVSIQPATGMQRVVGGRDMRSDEDGQHTADIRVIYSAIRLKTRDTDNEPDTLEYEGGTWIAIRDESWALNHERVYRTLVTRETRGAV